MGNCFVKLVSKRNTFFRFNRVLIAAVQSTIRCLVSQYHLRMLNKIAVYFDTVRIFCHIYPIRLFYNGLIALLQEDNICDNFRSGICTESVVRQPDRAQERCPFRQILPRRRVMCVHGIAAGDKS